MGRVSALTVELTGPERAELARCEAVIERGFRTFIEVGNALAEVRDARLYRAEHRTFQDYCRDQWGFSRKRAYDLIGAAAVAAELSQICDTPVQRESHAAALAAVPKSDREKVWVRAVEAANGKPTATTVKSVAATLTGAGGSAPVPVPGEVLAAAPAASNALESSVSRTRSAARRLPCGVAELCEAEPDHTDEILDRIADLAATKISDEAVGERLGMSTARVTQLADQHRIHIRQKMGPRKAAEVPSWTMELAVQQLAPGAMIGGEWFFDEDYGHLDPAAFAELDPACVNSWVSRLTDAIEHLQTVRQLCAEVVVVAARHEGRAS